MKVVVEIIIEKCSQCPNCKYEGTSWSEDVYSCKKTGYEINPDTIPSTCPFIESTINKLMNKDER